MNGWLSSSRIFFSFSMWSTCLDWMMSCFFIDLMATFAVGFFLSHANFTFPKAPSKYLTINFQIKSRMSPVQDRGAVWNGIGQRSYLLQG